MGKGTKINWDNALIYIKRYWCVDKVKLGDLPGIMEQKHSFKARYVCTNNCLLPKAGWCHGSNACFDKATETSVSSRRAYASKLKNMGWGRYKTRIHGDTTTSAHPIEPATALGPPTGALAALVKAESNPPLKNWDSGKFISDPKGNN